MTNIRRRLFAPPLTDSLPSGYTKLEYLQGYNDGQLFIDSSGFPGFSFTGTKGGQLYLDFSLES